MKIERELSGVFIRVEEGGKWKSKCFEDCSVETQEQFLSEKDPEWIKSLAIILGKTLNDIGEHLDISRKLIED